VFARVLQIIMATGSESSDIVRALATIAGALSTPSSSGSTPAVPPSTNVGSRGERTQRTDTTQALQDTTRRSDNRCVCTYNAQQLGVESCIQT